MSKPVLTLEAQVALQCKVVAHLSRALAEIHDDYVKIFEAGGKGPSDIADMVGARTASLMETLGDVLNGMDAASKDDEWTHPIFHEAHRLWPSASRLRAVSQP